MGRHTEHEAELRHRDALAITDISAESRDQPTSSLADMPCLHRGRDHRQVDPQREAAADREQTPDLGPEPAHRGEVVSLRSARPPRPG